MHLITIIIALSQMRGSMLQDNAWLDLFFDKMLGIEQWFYDLSWLVWGIVVLITIVLMVAKFVFNKGLKEIGFGFGCLSIVLLIWPFLEWISLVLISGVANNFDATGITNLVPFLIYAFFYFTLGGAG